MALQGQSGADKGKVDMTDYKYKYMYNLLSIVKDKDAPSKWFKAVCVKSCPAKGATSDCIRDGGSKSGCPVASDDLSNLGGYGTHLVRGYCLPDKAALKGGFNKLMEVMSSNSAFTSSMNDIQLCWQVILGMCAATVVISLIYVFLLKWIVKPILYISMVLILGLFVLFGLWSMMKRQEYDPTTQKKNYQYATAGMAIGFALAGIYAIFICCCYHNISLGASIMEAASDFVSQNLRIIFLPIFAYVFALVFFAYWVVTCIYLYGVGDVKFNSKLPIATVENNQ